jgi:two-component system, NarL family, sensor kinase
MANRLTAATSLALIMLLAWTVWIRLSAPSDGSVVQLSNTVWHQDRIPVSSTLCPCGGLRAGDTVLAVAGPQDGTYRYTVERDGARHDVIVRPGAASWPGLVRNAWSSLLTVVLMLAVGWFAFAHRPRGPATRTLLLLSSLFAFGTTTWLLGDTALRLATRGPRLVDVLGELSLALVWGAGAHFAVVTPGTTLRVPGRVVAGLYALPLGLHVGYLAVVLPSGDGRLEALGRIAQISLLPTLVMPAVVAALMIASYRRTPAAIDRRRLRWVLITFVLSAVSVLVLWSIPMLWDRPAFATVLLPTALLPPVVALAAAILRYRLFDIEVIVRRSLLYGALTVCVLAIYLSVGLLFGHLTGAGSGLAAILATCLVAFSIEPIRNWLQARIGRLVYGDRDNPFAVVAGLSRVQVAASPETALRDVAAALARALRLTYVGIELHTPDNRPAVAIHVGEPGDHPHAIPLHQGSVSLGRLLLSVGPGQERFGPADRRLLEALNRQLGGAAAVVLLNAELRESRHRLVLAREEERRRIAHTLHHGLEGRLAAHIERLEAARAVATISPGRAEAELDATMADTRRAVKDLRVLVAGLRPPAVDEFGLLDAIRERVGRQYDESGGGLWSWEVVAQNDLGELPAAVEVAAFWIVVEAARHAKPDGTSPLSRATFARRGDLFVEVHHDCGFTTGPGMDSAAERAAELGGTLTTTASAVRARLPIRERT